MPNTITDFDPAAWVEGAEAQGYRVTYFFDTAQKPGEAPRRREGMSVNYPQRMPLDADLWGWKRNVSEAELARREAALKVYLVDSGRYVATLDWVRLNGEDLDIEEGGAA